MDIKDKVKRFKTFQFTGSTGVAERKEVYDFCKANIGKLGNGISIKQSSHRHGGDCLNVGGQKVRPESSMSQTWREVVRQLSTAAS